MAKDNGSKQKRSILQRALLAIFGESSNGFVPERAQQAANDSADAAELEKAKRLVQDDDHGEMIANELQNRLDGGEAPEDALATIEDAFSILRGERGEYALEAFLRKLRELTTGGNDEDIIPEARPPLPENLADSAKLGEGVAKWLEDVLMFRQAEPEKDAKLIDYLRGIVAGKYGPEAIKSFRMTLFAMMIRENDDGQAEAERKQAAFDAEAEALAQRAEQVREAVRPRFDPDNYPGTLDDEKDGRLYAMALLKEIKRLDESDKGGLFSAVPEVPDKHDPAERIVFRTGPQSSLIRDAFDQIYQVNEDSRRGFFTIITDHLGQSHGGTYDPETYEEWEAQGRFSGPSNDKPAKVVPIKPGMYVPEKHSNPLETQRDGRLYAMDVLDELEGMDVHEAALNPAPPAESYGAGDKWEPYRTGPQADGFYKDLTRLIKEGSEEAIKGFAAVFTASLAGDIGRAGDYFRGDEEAGLNQDLGTPGSAAEPPEGVTDGKVEPHAAFNAKAQQQPQKKVGASRKQTKAELWVTDKLDYLQLAIDQLHDIGKRLDESPYSHFTTNGAVEALAAQMLSALAECQNKLPKGHPAKKEVKKATEAVNDLIHSTKQWVEAVESGGEPFDKAQGKAMVAFVVEAAQAIERAEIACGENTGTGGWLDNPGMDPNAGA